MKTAVPPPPIFHQRGFSLIEIAIVLFIVSLLLGGMLLPLSAQQDMRARQETEKTLSDIRDALMGFAITNGRLPRPATSATDGSEAAICAGDAACTGFIPWAALGSAKLDGWGKLIRYSVTPAYANAAITLSPSPTPANRTVQTRDNAGTAVYLAGSLNCTTQCVPAVIFSQGKSHWGTTDAGLALADGSATNTDEDANNAGPVNYFSRSPTDNTATPGGEFDDTVLWLSGNTLFNRMVAAGKLP